VERIVVEVHHLPEGASTMRFTRTTTVLTAALLAAGASPALAQESAKRIEAENHQAAMRSIGRFQQQIAADLAPQTSPAKATQTVRVVRSTVADDGFDWADGAIGAGLAAALLLAGTGLASARRHPSAKLHRAS
jgi:hypothetical protein